MNVAARNLDRVWFVRYDVEIRVSAGICQPLKPFSLLPKLNPLVVYPSLTLDNLAGMIVRPTKASPTKTTVRKAI